MCASACLGRSSGPTLRIAGDGDIGLSNDGIGSHRPGRPAVWGSMILCLSSPGRVTITSVEPVNPRGGLEVQAFAVRPNPALSSPPGGMIGDDRATLSGAGFGSTSHVVTTVCGGRDSGRGVELAVQATRPSREDAASDAWRITWKSATSSGSFDFPLAVELCGEKTADAPPCERLNPLR